MVLIALIDALAFGTAVVASPFLTTSQAYYSTTSTTSSLALSWNGIGESPIPTGDGGIAISGALDPSAVPHNYQLSAPPNLLTITVLNNHDVPISTMHGVNEGAPTAVSGNVNPGTLSIGESAVFAVPTNWAGRVSFNEAKYPISGDNSLIEANFVYRPEPKYQVAVADVDVSYVDGFSLPITCVCGNDIVSGCQKNLFDSSQWSNGPCPTRPNARNACPNPLRRYEHVNEAVKFFKPCEHQAYTYPNDSQANSFGACQSGQILCCVGEIGCKIV